MKNFSVKTADFDSLSISGESPIVQSDLGTAPNQIPLNKDLGSLAYMNAPEIEDLNVDTLELREMAAEMSETAVDVFVYDTRKDSDGGAWRHRTSHTSWYNEELNTSTRGGRREFPAVAVIVAEANKVTIYDGDDPDLPMWMVFEQEGSTAGTANLIGPTQASSTSVFMLNGLISITEDTWGAGLITANFLSEGFIHYWQASKNYNGNISQRNDSVGYSNGDNEVIVNGSGNDVAMTVLPNAPIDSDTGLPIPTIAVATDGGVSVIKDDGSVVDLYRSSGDEYCYTIAFDSNNSLFVSWGVTNSTRRHVSYWDVIPNSDDTEMTDNYYSSIKNRGGSFAGDGGLGNVKISNHARAFASTDNFEKLTLLDHNNSDTSKSQFCDITSRYNTGWMPGDTKLAALSDTKNETVGEDESISASLISNGESWTGASSTLSSTLPEGWEMDSIYSSLVSVAGGELTIKENNTNDYGIVFQTFYIEAEKTYTLKAKFKANTGNARVWIGTSPKGATDDVVKYFQNSSDTYTEISHTFSRDSSVIGNGNVKVTIAAHGANAEAVFEYVSVTEAGELISNGTFDNIAIDGEIRGWSDESTGTGSISHNASGYIDLISQGSGNRAVADQSFSTVIGKTYTLSLEVIATDENSSVYLGTSAGGNDITDSKLNLLSLGSHSFTFVATTTTTFIRLWGSTGTSTNTLDNISVRLAEDDRSVNDNGLQIFGQIDKTPVAPGADLVAYSGFSADDYLMQPYNPDLDFGMGDYYWSLWINSPASGADIPIFCQGRYTTGMYALVLNSEADKKNTIRLGDGGGYCHIYGHEGEGWIQISAKRTRGLIQSYKNGVLQDSVESNYDINQSISSEGLMVGAMLTGSGSLYSKFFQGKLALFRISATAPTDAQIAKIYRDEKPLFRDGAQTTLYGTSDAVTALAYDDSENLLHVGTASGRSSFNGLKRVDNTITAVSTAISATEGLVIEQ